MPPPKTAAPAAHRALAARALLAAALLGLGACNGSPDPSGQVAPATASPTIRPTAAAVASPTPDALAAARADLDLLTRQLDTVHPNAFHGIDREAWIAERDVLAAGLYALTPEAAVVGLQRLVGLLSRDGRDGHQLALPAPGSEPPVLPIRVYEFDDGVFVTAALPPHEDLVGARIVAVNGHPIADVLEAIDPLVPRDGPATVRLFRPVLFLRTEVMRGLGLAGGSAAGPAPVSLTLATPGADARDVMLDPVPFADHRAWAGDFGMFRLAERPTPEYVADLETVMSWRFLDASGTLVLRYTQVRPVAATDLEAFAARATAGDVERVVLDLRQNPGGDNHNIAAILPVLQRPEINRPGRLFVLTDHVTFSAASNFATQIEASTAAIFAGQAMGGGLNFWNDVTWVRLEHWPLPMQVGVSTRYWQFAEPGDPRLTIEPAIGIPSRSTDYFGGLDPILDAIDAFDAGAG